MIRFPDFNGLALAGSCNVALVYWLEQIEDSMVSSRAMQLDVFRMCPEERHRCIGGSTEAKIWRDVGTIPDLLGQQSNSLREIFKSLQIGQGVASSCKCVMDGL